MKIGEVDFNKEWASKKSLEDFEKVHKHHADEVDLKDAHAQMQDKKEPAKKEK